MNMLSKNRYKVISPARSVLAHGKIKAFIAVLTLTIAALSAIVDDDVNYNLDNHFSDSVFYLISSGKEKDPPKSKLTFQLISMKEIVNEKRSDSTSPSVKLLINSEIVSLRNIFDNADFFIFDEDSLHSVNYLRPTSSRSPPSFS